MLEWRRVRAVCLVIGMLAMTTSASAGVRVENLWPTRTIEFVICTDAESDSGDRKRCEEAQRLDAAMLAKIRAGVAEWNRTFAGHIELREVKRWDDDVVWIIAPWPGQSTDTCNVNNLGYIRGDARVITFGSTCGPDENTAIGTILHEIGHLVGLHHEQRRPDRDDYVIVDQVLLRSLANAPPNAKGGWGEDKKTAYQYAKLCDPDALYCTSDFGIRNGPAAQFGRENGIKEGLYDFDSVMHYSLFLKEGDRRMADVTAVGAARLQQQGLTRLNIGQRDRLSSGDIATVKSLYPKVGG